MMFRKDAAEPAVFVRFRSSFYVIIVDKIAVFDYSVNVAIFVWKNLMKDKVQ